MQLQARIIFSARVWWGLARAQPHFHSHRYLQWRSQKVKAVKEFVPPNHNSNSWFNCHEFHAIAFMLPSVLPGAYSWWKVKTYFQLPRCTFIDDACAADCIFNDVECSKVLIEPHLSCRRGYTASRYQRIIDNIRRHMPNASVSGDAIVGFPGETEEQFQATCRSVINCICRVDLYLTCLIHCKEPAKPYATITWDASNKALQLLLIMIIGCWRKHLHGFALGMVAPRTVSEHIKVWAFNPMIMRSPFGVSSSQ